MRVPDRIRMGVTVWWQLYHLQHLRAALPPALAASMQTKADAYGEFIQSVVMPNGAVPTYPRADGTVFDCGARAGEG